MYYIIYRTVNLINNKEYIGQHKTTDLNDGYLGSGLLLRWAIQKYGRQNFKREVLYYCATETEMNAKEKELVNERYLCSEHTYNIRLGGTKFPGRAGDKNTMFEKKHSSETKSKISSSIRGNKNPMFNKNHTEKTKQKMSKANKGRLAGRKNPMFGKKHSDEIKDKISKARKNRVWVYDPITSVQKAVDKADLDHYLAQGWRRGRIKYQKAPRYLLSF